MTSGPGNIFCRSRATSPLVQYTKQRGCSDTKRDLFGSGCFPLPHGVATCLRPVRRQATTVRREFLRLLGEHERRLRGFILALVPHWADADDIAQEVRLRLWEQFDDYDPAKDFGASGADHRPLPGADPP